MKHTILASALLAGLGLGASTLPSAALPMNASGVTAPAKPISSRCACPRPCHRPRHRMRQGSASRGNAAMPSRGARGQQYGSTTGGPRR